MAATFGVTDLFDLAAPDGGVVEETSSEDSVDAATIRDQTGTTCRAIAKPMITTTVTMKGRGLSLAPLVAGDLSGSVTVISRKNTETNDDFPTFEETGKAYSSL